METVPEFGLELKKGDHMISFDIRAGYPHFRLSPSIRDLFCFRYYGRYYRCVALPFGWGRSPMWFTQFMVPVVTHLRGVMKFRVLAYLDDFLVVPSICGTASSARDCRRAVRPRLARIDETFQERRVARGDASGTSRVGHRHQGDAVHSVAAEGGPGEGDGGGDYTRDAARMTVGVGSSLTVVLRALCLLAVSCAPRPILYPGPIRLLPPVQDKVQAIVKTGDSRAPFSSGGPRSAVVDHF
jgi:Reverse transcriptase (RNA-dependent DNA polymerase)